MKEITKEALLTCISSTLPDPEISLDKPLLFTCAEVHHIYHRYLKSHVSSGLVDQESVLDAFISVLESRHQPCYRVGFYKELGRELGVEII